MYAAPPEFPVSAPALVIGPRTPYLQRSNVCSWEQSLVLTLAIQRASGLSGLDQLDDMVIEVEQVLQTGTVQTVLDSVGDLGPVQEGGGVEYLTATIDVTAYI